ncbi:MAG TPA: DUF1707 domain-containing protein [Nocardioides sp.]|nr:DUF1707 domain-containing protein [Nocardioides sp.]
MTTGSSGSLWGRFEHDPRDPAYAGMRASDRDRAVVHDVLAEAYSEGRIDRDELDERTTQVDAAKTYADLVPPLQDLTVDAATPAVSVVRRPDLQRQAEGYYVEKRSEALMGFLIPNLICWAIWFMTGHDAFIWPVFVLIPTAGNLVRVLASKQSIIDGRVEKLERRQAKALEPPEPKSQPKSQPKPSQDTRILSEQEKPEEA